MSTGTAASTPIGIFDSGVGGLVLAGCGQLVGSGLTALVRACNSARPVRPGLVETGDLAAGQRLRQRPLSPEIDQVGGLDSDHSHRNEVSVEPKIRAPEIPVPETRVPAMRIEARSAGVTHAT